VAEILSQNTRDSKLSHGENQMSLSHLGSDRHRVVTDTKTELPQLIRAMLALTHKKLVANDIA